MNWAAIIWFCLMVGFLIAEAACPFHLISVWFAAGSLVHHCGQYMLLSGSSAWKNQQKAQAAKQQSSHSRFPPYSVVFPV